MDEETLLCNGFQKMLDMNENSISLIKELQDGPIDELMIFHERLHQRLMEMGEFVDSISSSGSEKTWHSLIDWSVQYQKALDYDLQQEQKMKRKHTIVQDTIDATAQVYVPKPKNPVTTHVKKQKPVPPIHFAYPNKYQKVFPKLHGRIGIPPHQPFLVNSKLISEPVKPSKRSCIRWTEEEAAAFHKTYTEECNENDNVPSKVEKIGKVIKSKTKVQIRSYFQRYERKHKGK